MASNDDQGRVSTISRVLAWIVVALFAVSLAVATIKWIIRGYWASNAETTILALVGMAVFAPIFLFVAWKGRSPKWLTSFEQFPDRFAARRGIRADGMIFYERTLMHTVLASFGVGLYFLGNSLGLFESPTALFAILAFTLAWLIVLALLTIYIRKRRVLRRGAASPDRGPAGVR